MNKRGGHISKEKLILIEDEANMSKENYILLQDKVKLNTEN